MASLQGRADVLSAKSLSPLTVSRVSAATGSKFPLAAQDSSSNLCAIRGLFTTADASVEVPEEGEKGKKRRKLENGSATIAEPADIDETKSIVLAKVSLDLVGRHVAFYEAR